MDDTNDELLTIKQLQKYLQVSRSMVYEFIWQKENPLPVLYLSERIPRFRKTDVEKWLEEQFLVNTKENDEGR